MAGLIVNHRFDPQLRPVNLTSPNPVMHAFSSILLLGACAVQSVFGRPEDARIRRESAVLKRSVDSFIEKETPYAWQRLLCNIGSTGCAASGAASGVVVASPSKSNPDCKLA